LFLKAFFGLLKGEGQPALEDRINFFLPIDGFSDKRGAYSLELLSPLGHVALVDPTA
jgi:hypothetical protein